MKPSLRSIALRSKRFFGHAAVCVFIAACGGGGGGGGDGAGGSPPTPPPPPGAAPTGRLWHDNFALDNARGFQLSPLNGERSRLLGPLDTAVPTPDGMHFVVYDYDISSRVSTVVIRATSTGAEFARASFDGYVHRVRPSPLRLGELLVTWDDCAGCVTAGQGNFSLVDLPGRRTLSSFSRVNAAADWLPDGRYVHIDAAGRVHVGTPAGTRTQVGTLAVAGRTVQSLWVDPAGRQMIARWDRRRSDGALDASDLWISAIEGTDLQQLTATRFTTYGQWSPDGAFFAFNNDTGILCTTPGCSGTPVGTCDLYAAPASARGLSTASPQVQSFTVVAQDGRSRTLGCNLRGWTR